MQARMAAGDMPVRADEALLLDAALETIPYGFCVWSDTFELVLWNRHYIDIYAFPEGSVRRGMSLRDMVDLSSSLGNHTDTNPQAFYDAYTSELLANRSGARATRHETISGDRTLETTHVYAPGLGWVITHEDVTEELKRNAALMDGKRELERQYTLLDAAINNINQGLSMLDADMRLVTCNAKFAEMYGLPPELIAPGTPYVAILDHRIRTGRHAPLDRDAFLRERIDIMAGNRFVSEVVHTRDNTHIALRHQPLKGGGVVSTHEDITGQLANEARMRHMATHDTLTDLPNRALFREQLEKAFAGAGGESFALLVVNLDQFRAINDSDGHRTGDKVLRKAACRLSEALGEAGMVARLGADEFAVLLNAPSDPFTAARQARMIGRALAEPYRFGRKTLALSASIGIAMAPSDGRRPDTLINNADLALARAKREGRGTYHFFERGMDAALQRRRTLEAGLRGALSNGEMSLVYQPLIALEAGCVAAAEALLRWNHPQLGTISPDEFIPLAEENGVITDLGAWVLKTAMREAATWPKAINLAVNLSPVQFLRRDLVATVREALRDSGLAPKRLELEITESLLLDESQNNLDMLHVMRRLGVRIAMDDFGTGYSSLSYLRAFPFDKIKIDRSFMSDITTRRDSLAILKAMLELGRSLGMATVAEGVETREQLDIIRTEGCTQVQGYFYSAPVSAEELRLMLSAQAPVPVLQQAG